MFDIFVIGKNNSNYKKIKQKFMFAKKANDLIDAQKKSLTNMFWVIWDDVEVDDNFNFDYDVPKWDQIYTHVFKNGEHFDGICLIPKNKEFSEREIEYRFFVDKKEVDITVSKPRPYDVFEIDNYEEYVNALENSTTDMFWAVSRNLKVDKDFKFDLYFSHHDVYHRGENHAFIHRVDDKDLYNGIFLLSKKKFVSQKEIDYRFLINRKEWDIVASGPVEYDKFVIDSYEDYQNALKNSRTEMFWMLGKKITPKSDFKFDFYFSHDQEYDRHINHAFVHQVNDKFTYDGIFLCSKHVPLSKNEIEFRYFIERKEWDIVASGPRLYDVFEIDSYDQYLEAMEKAETEMFWMTSRNIAVKKDFKFDIFFDDRDDEFLYDRNENHAFLHQVDDKLTRDGIFLLSKNKPVSRKEIDHRFLINRKEWDVVASGPKLYDVFVVDSYEEYLYALENTTTEMFWITSKNISVRKGFSFDLYFDDRDDEFLYDRNENHAFVHQVGEKKTYDGIFLMSKSKPVSQKEIDHRFLINRKEWSIVASGPKLYDIFEIDSYEEYLHALENTTTEMFWMTSKNIKVDESFEFDIFFDDRDDEQLYDRHENHAFIHRVGDKDLYNGVFLLSKHKPISQREVENRYLIDRKEWGIVASGPVEYDKFVVDTYNDYLDAVEKSRTEMFWIIPDEVKISEDFKFDLYFSHDDIFNRNIHHSFQHKFRDELNFNGINLVCKNKVLSEKEIEFRFVLEKKDHEIVASELKPYEVIFISYNEPNADRNYERLLKFRPDAKRVHGVKGIHNAHIKAAQISKTSMFWVVDGDAIVEDQFAFDYQVPIWDRTTVHVWHSRNPINNLEYGYGGVKLLPRDLTLKLNTSTTDMTTSISKSFKVVEQVSNITEFNTDPFSTWRSAFRECVKLSSKSIDRQIDEETKNRLEIWTTVGEDKPFGEFAIKGAKAAIKFVNENPDKLNKINDFDDLYNLFLKDTR